MATLMGNMFPESPERKDCHPDFPNDSFLSSEIHNPLDESFKVDDLDRSNDASESQGKNDGKNFFIVQVQNS